MKKVLLKVMTKSGQIQEGILEMVPGSCTYSYLYCKLDEGVKKNCLVLDTDGDVQTSKIEYVKPYIVDTDEPTVSEETTSSKGEKFHRSSIIKDEPTVIAEEKHIYTKDELDSLDEEGLEEVADLFGIDTLELFDHEIIEAILEKQEHQKA